jgi:hypothetical protein
MPRNALCESVSRHIILVPIFSETLALPAFQKKIGAI